LPNKIKKEDLEKQFPFTTKQKIKFSRNFTAHPTIDGTVLAQSDSYTISP